MYIEINFFVHIHKKHMKKNTSTKTKILLLLYKKIFLNNIINFDNLCNGITKNMIM